MQSSMPPLDPAGGSRDSACSRSDKMRSAGKRRGKRHTRALLFYSGDALSQLMGEHRRPTLHSAEWLLGDCDTVVSSRVV